MQEKGFGEMIFGEVGYNPASIYFFNSYHRKSEGHLNLFSESLNKFQISASQHHLPYICKHFIV